MVTKPYIFISKTNSFPLELVNEIEYNFNLSGSSDSIIYYEDYLYLIVGNLKNEKIRLVIENENLPGSSLYISKMDGSSIVGWKKQLDFNILTDNDIIVFKYRYEVINNKYVIDKYLEQSSFLNCYLISSKDPDDFNFAYILDKPDIGTNNIDINENETKYYRILNYNSLYTYKLFSSSGKLYLKIDKNILEIKAFEVNNDENVTFDIYVEDGINYPNQSTISVNIHNT